MWFKSTACFSKHQIKFHSTIVIICFIPVHITLSESSFKNAEWNFTFQKNVCYSFNAEKFSLEALTFNSLNHLYLPPECTQCSYIYLNFICRQLHTTSCYMFRSQNYFVMLIHTLLYQQHQTTEPITWLYQSTKWCAFYWKPTI